MFKYDRIKLKNLNNLQNVVERGRKHKLLIKSDETTNEKTLLGKN